MSLIGHAASRGSLRKYRVLAAKGFIQNLQYTASHLVNSVASAILACGVYFWLNVTPVDGFADYAPHCSPLYNHQPGLCLVHSVRLSGPQEDKGRRTLGTSPLSRCVPSISTYRLAAEYGSMVYGLLFRIPVALMLSTLGFYIPKHPATWGWTLLALLLGAYIAITNMYMVGLTAFWTTEIRTASWVMSSMSLGLGGVAFPLEVLPDRLYPIARWSPFACLNYNPARIYLELSGPELVLPGLVWGIIVTVIAQALTKAARRKLEVQGG